MCIRRQGDGIAQKTEDGFDHHEPEIEADADGKCRTELAGPWT
jgi:hypothetical protein